MSVLLIDIGNTRIKWQTRQQGEILAEGHVDKDKAPHYAWPDGIGEVAVSSVSTNEELHELFGARYGDRLRWIAHPVEGHAGFHHCYADPKRLGVDRWLAMLGARAIFNDDLLVVDAGTALTLDLLDENNQHVGGYIVPGIQMAQRALFGGTDRVRPFSDEQHDTNLAPGKSTVACVEAGVLHQQVALVKSVAENHKDFRLVITGGDGAQLADWLDSGYYPNLIFDGMELLCAG